MLMDTLYTQVMIRSESKCVSTMLELNLLLFGKNLKSIKEMEESQGTMMVFFFASSRHQLLEENICMVEVHLQQCNNQIKNKKI